MCLSYSLNLIKSSSLSMTFGRKVLHNLISLLTLFFKQQATTQQTQEMAKMIRPIITHDTSPSEKQSSLSKDGEVKKKKKVITVNFHFYLL